MDVQVIPSYVEVLASNNNAADFYVQLTSPSAAMVVIELEVSGRMKLGSGRDALSMSTCILTGPVLSRPGG